VQKAWTEAKSRAVNPAMSTGAYPQPAVTR
jgi:hypothetical protein